MQERDLSYAKTDLSVSSLPEYLSPMGLSHFLFFEFFQFEFFQLNPISPLSQKHFTKLIDSPHMRFTTTATILLSQVLPALTRESTETGKDFSRTPSLKHITNVTNKPGSSNPRTQLRKGSHSTISSHTNTHHDQNIKDFILENKSHVDKQSGKECDFTSEDADVGILSCGEGLYCRESAESKLGGECSDIARSLQSCSSNNCNCRMIQNYIVCYVDYSCETVCSLNVCTRRGFIGHLVNGRPSSNQTCLFVSKPYTAKICNYFSNATCTITINGAMCQSCSLNHYYDCTNIPGGIKGKYPTAIQEALSTGKGPFCPPMAMMTTPNTGGSLPALTIPAAAALPITINGGAGGNNNSLGAGNEGKINSPPAPVTQPAPTSPMAVLSPQPAATAASEGPPNGLKKGKS